MLSEGESLFWPEGRSQQSEQRNIIKFAMQNREDDDGVLCSGLRAQATCLISGHSNVDKNINKLR